MRDANRRALTPMREAARQDRTSIRCLAWAALFLAMLAPESTRANLCHAPVDPDGHEPPCNPELAQSEWPGAHRGSYKQASSPYAGPTPADVVVPLQVPIDGAPIVVSATAPDADGGRAVWGTTVVLWRIFKFDFGTGRLIDVVQPESPFTISNVSGAYSVVDVDHNLIGVRGRNLGVWGDSVPGDRFSPIETKRYWQLPDAAFCGSGDNLVGIVMLWDGTVVLSTSRGNVIAVPRDPALMTGENLVVHSLNPAQCEGSLPAEDQDVVSNDIAADEDGGVYVVTSQAMYKVVWDPVAKTLSPGWRARYELGEAAGGARLGPGSGSTPTLMGKGDGDRFVVITDGQKLMHLTLLWRDEIPPGWQPIAPGKDPRIACEIPVTFGNPAFEETVSEQSVMVRGYSAVVVNNQMPVIDQSPLPQSLGGLAPLLVLSSNLPANAPFGVERFDWDPVTQTCASTWANPDLSIPNGIPSMSAATNLFYGIGQKAGIWGLEAIDFDTGASRAFFPSSPLPFHNSFFAATTIGPERNVYTGTFGGVTIYRPVATLPE